MAIGATEVTGGILEVWHRFSLHSDRKALFDNFAEPKKNNWERAKKIMLETNINFFNEIFAGELVLQLFPGKTLSSGERRASWEIVSCQLTIKKCWLAALFY